MKRLLTIILLSAAMCGMSIVCEAQKQVDVNIYDPYGEFPKIAGTVLIIFSTKKS